MPRPDLDFHSSRSTSDSHFQHRQKLQCIRFEAALDRQFPTDQDKANPFWNTACRVYLRTEFSRLSMRKKTALIHQIEAQQIDPEALDIGQHLDIASTDDGRRMSETIRAVLAHPPSGTIVRTERADHSKTPHIAPRKPKS